MRARPEERFFKNAQTWKQISTNVPPEMLTALKQHVTKEYTMSHLLRDLIQESDIMRGELPSPQWSVQLSKNLADLKQEMAEVRKDLAESREIAISEGVPTLTLRQQRQIEQARLVTLLQDQKAVALSNQREMQTMQFAPDYDPFSDDEPQEELVKAVEQTVQQNVDSPGPTLTKTRSPMSLFGRITEMLGVARRTA